MADAPEKIWAAPVTDNYGEWQTSPDGLPRPTEYTRSDLVAELLAENERLKVDVGECNLVTEQQDRHAAALSRTSAVKVKALEWGSHHNPVFAGPDIAVASFSVFGMHLYQVHRDPRGPGFLALLAPKYGTEFWSSKGHASLEAAQAAAQADYERRILSALASHQQDTNATEDYEEGDGE